MSGWRSCCTPYTRTHTHKCVTEGAQSEQSGFSRGTGHTDLCWSRKHTSPGGIRRPVFRTNGHLMNDAAEERGWFPNCLLHETTLLASLSAIRESQRALEVAQRRLQALRLKLCRLHVCISAWGCYYHPSPSSAGTQPPETGLTVNPV